MLRVLIFGAVNLSNILELFSQIPLACPPYSLLGKNFLRVYFRLLLEFKLRTSMSFFNLTLPVNNAIFYFLPLSYLPNLEKRYSLKKAEFKIIFNEKGGAYKPPLSFLESDRYKFTTLGY